MVKPLVTPMVTIGETHDETHPFSLDQWLGHIPSFAPPWAPWASGRIDVAGKVFVLAQKNRAGNHQLLKKSPWISPTSVRNARRCLTIIISP